MIQGLGFGAIVRMRKTGKKSEALTFGSFVSRQMNIKIIIVSIFFIVLSLEERTKESKAFKGNF